MADSRQQQALAYFVSMGWTPEQAAGIVANLVAESGLNPAATGDGGAAYGIAQWHGDRQRGFEALLGKPIQGSSLEDQLAWVNAELNATEKKAGDALRLCQTASVAGSTVSSLYERPEDVVGEGQKRGQLAQAIFTAYGGTIQPATPPATPAQPIAQPQPAPAPQVQGMPILALLSAFGPVIAQLIPQIATLVSGDRAKQNLDLAGKVIDTITQAAGAPNLQAAVEGMQQDPATLKKVTDAVVTHPDIQPNLQLVELGGGVQAARDADVKQQASSEPFWKGSAVFWISVILVPMVLWYVGSSIVGGMIPVLKEAGVEMPSALIFILALFGTAWDSGARVGLANLVVGLVLGGICGVYYGVSVTQQKQAAQTTLPATGDTAAN